MSLPDCRVACPALKPVVAALIAVSLFATSACTVRPLYGDAVVSGGETMAAALSAVEVKPVDTRQALEVRNHLIFLLTRGAGQPAGPQWQMALRVTSRTASTATVQVATDNEPSAGTVTMTASYTLTDAASGDVVARGKRVATASFDRARQQFATIRAERDAENRAARELAELLRLALVHDLERGSAQ